jgi:hypothetical protein
MMSQLSIFEETAVYDAAKGLLEISGETRRRHGVPAPVAIHVAVKQLTPDGSFLEAGRSSVPRRLLGEGTWKARIKGDFVAGKATAFGMSVEFVHEPGAFETSVWARTITIEPGTLSDDPASA